jgi:hypothetical protein
VQTKVAIEQNEVKEDEEVILARQELMKIKQDTRETIAKVTHERTQEAPAAVRKEREPVKTRRTRQVESKKDNLDEKDIEKVFPSRKRTDITEHVTQDSKSNNRPTKFLQLRNTIAQRTEVLLVYDDKKVFSLPLAHRRKFTTFNKENTIDYDSKTETCQIDSAKRTAEELVQKALKILESKTIVLLRVTYSF